MLSALLGDNPALVVLVSSAACGLLGFLIGRHRDLSGWIGAAMGVGLNLAVMFRSHVRLTTWVTGYFGLPYSDGAAAIVLVAVLALAFPYPLIAARSRRYAAAALGIMAATTVLAILIHFRLSDLWEHVPAQPAGNLPAAVVDAVAAKSSAPGQGLRKPEAPKPPPPVETEVLTKVAATTPLYRRQAGLLVPSTFMAYEGDWVLVLPAAEPREEDFVEVLLPTSGDTYVVNWSPRGFMRARHLGPTRTRAKPSIAARQPERRPSPPKQAAGLGGP